MSCGPHAARCHIACAQCGHPAPQHKGQNHFDEQRQQDGLKRHRIHPPARMLVLVTRRPMRRHRCDQSLTLIAVSPSSSTKALRQDLPSNNALRTASACRAMVQIGGDQRAAGAQQPAQRLVQRRRRRLAVEKGDVVAGIERRQHGGEVAFMHCDAMIHRDRRDVVAGELHMVGIALDGIDGGIGRARRKRQRGVAERRAQFQDAARVGGRRQRRRAADRCHKDMRRSRAARDARRLPRVSWQIGSVRAHAASLTRYRSNCIGSG